jgi:hypothetical protein
MTTNRALVDEYLQKQNPQPKNLEIFFQDEHNLVLPGGRSVEHNCPIGKVESIFNSLEKYHVRVAKANYYYSSDIILEYNTPNIVNIKRSGLFPPVIMEKIIYCPALPYNYAKNKDRERTIITSFVNESEPRRSWIMQRLHETCEGYENIQGVFDLNELENLYSSTKIVVNTHQTYHHHSIEEFRVLPALSRGCIVISEKVPLVEEIPYGKFVIWCDYEDVPKVSSQVLQNYDLYFDKIHGGDELKLLLEKMKDEFAANMDSLLGNKNIFNRKQRVKRKMIGDIFRLKISTKRAFAAPANKACNLLRRMRSTGRMMAIFAEKVAKSNTRRQSSAR